MDPKANLREQASLATLISQLTDKASESDLTPDESATLIVTAARLAELSIAYCEWIRKGGFAA